MRFDDLNTVGAYLITLSSFLSFQAHATNRDLYLQCGVPMFFISPTNLARNVSSPAISSSCANEKTPCSRTLSTYCSRADRNLGEVLANTLSTYYVMLACPSFAIEKNILCQCLIKERSAFRSDHEHSVGETRRDLLSLYVFVSDR